MSWKNLFRSYWHLQKPWITGEEDHEALFIIKNDKKKVQSDLQKIEDDLSTLNI